MKSPARRFDWLHAYAIFFVILLYGPVFLLLVFSFNDSIYIAFPLKAFTVRWYGEMADNPFLMAALRNSLKVGIAVALVSTALGMVAAWVVVRCRMPARGAVVGLIMLPLVVPSLILGIALLIILRMVFDVQLSLWTIGIGHVLICLPFSMLVLMSRLEGFDRKSRRGIGGSRREWLDDLLAGDASARAPRCRS